MKVEIVTESAKFEELEGPWQALAARSRARPFQDFGWAAAWVRTIGATGGRRLNVGTLWDAGCLLAVFPVVVRREYGVRILEWIGAKVTDYCDVLVDPHLDADETVRRMWQEINRRGGFDVARLGQVRKDANVYATLHEMNPWVETREEAVGITLAAANGEEWLQQQNAKKRGQVRLGLRKMSRMGFEVRRWSASESLAPWIDAFIEQKRGWLAARGSGGFLMQSAGAEFLHALAAALNASGSLHLTSVHSPQEGFAAVHLGFVRDGVLYYYLPSYDPRWSKYGFGGLLRDSLIIWACDHGLKRFDMLLGDYDYKKHYDITAEPVRTLVIPRSLFGRMSTAIYRWRRA